MLLARMPAPLKPVRRAYSMVICDERNVQQADEANPAMKLQLTIESQWRRVSDPGRSALCT
jgi:hypothetical protein